MLYKQCDVGNLFAVQQSCISDLGTLYNSAARQTDSPASTAFAMLTSSLSDPRRASPIKTDQDPLSHRSDSQPPRQTVLRGRCAMHNIFGEREVQLTLI